MKNLANVLKIIGTVVVILLLVVSLPFATPRFFGYQVYRVATASMEPTLPVDAVIFVKNCSVEDVKVGDVITYKLGSEETRVLTHRVYDIDYEQEVFITKGDANADVDTEPVVFSRLLGEQVVCIPQLGFWAEFFDSKEGMILCIFAIIAVLVLWVSADLFSKTAELQKDKEKKKIDWVRVLLIVGGICLVAYASINILKTYLDYQDAIVLDQRIEGTYFTSHTTDAKTPWYDMVSVRLEELQEYNSDVIGWIYFENEDISYPILYAADNDAYIRTSIDKTPATTGCIFLEEKNTPDLEDSHSIIYGHNMRNLTMFGKLKYYNQKGYYEDHAYFQIFMNGVVHRYQIFGYAGVDSRNFVYSVPYGPTEGFAEFITNMKEQSLIDTDIPVTKDDKVITLSTCSKDTDRFVVHAVRVDSHYE